ncbi:MAG: MotA/TolQ/ExbB proton channel family protein [Methylocystaceae bacterium]|nr:MotA/TolQ/ExbB proton channel family protein [Methylocystaceae bacterium]
MSLDSYLYELSNFFLLPVQIGVVILFAYSIFALGEFVMQYGQRKLGSSKLHKVEAPEDMSSIHGHSILALFSTNPCISREDLELAASKELDFLRITTRIAPMLGLVATMIPMGPALKSLANGNVQGISENLIIAFTSVIFALLAASLTFWIQSVKKQWLIRDIRFVEHWRETNVHEFKPSVILKNEAADVA